MQALLYAYHVDESAVLQLILQRAGFEVRTAGDLYKTLESWPERPVDLMVISVDEVEEKLNSFVDQYRAQTLAPLVIITNWVEEEEHAILLENGADAVYNRPYSPRLLIAKLRALMRRAAAMPFFSLPLLTQSDVMIDPSTRTVQVGDKDNIHLTQLEFRLLFTLMTHAGRVIPSENLVEYVWGYSGEGNRGLVRGLVQRLRSKIEPDISNPRYIMTESGIGYSFNPYTED